MADPIVLYVVTGAVVLGLVIWVIVVLVTAPEAPDLSREQPLPRADAGKAAVIVEKEEAAALVVALPPMRQRLDSHQEISDTAGEKPSGEAGASESNPADAHRLVLVSAMGRTDPGARTNNEDAFAIIDRHHLFIIADSVGRHAAGGVASQLAVDAIAAFFDEPDAGGKKDDDPKLPRRANQLRGAVLAANRKIFERSRDEAEHAGMGTTVIGAYFAPDNQRVYIGRVGDSRCYRVRAGCIASMTKEHVAGAVGPRALGVEERVDVEIVVMAPEAGDIYLLCSDALSRAVKEAELLSLVKDAKGLEAAATAVVEAAKAGGGRDDITAILVRVDEPKKR